MIDTYKNEIRNYWREQLEPVTDVAAYPKSLANFYQEIGSFHNIDHKELCGFLSYMRFLKPEETYEQVYQGQKYWVFAESLGSRFMLKITDDTIWCLRKHVDLISPTKRETRMVLRHIDHNVFRFMFYFTRFCSINQKNRTFIKRMHGRGSYEQFYHLLRDIEEIARYLSPTYHKWLAVEYLNLMLDIKDDKIVENHDNTWWFEKILIACEDFDLFSMGEAFWEKLRLEDPIINSLLTPQD